MIKILLCLTALVLDPPNVWGSPLTHTACSDDSPFSPHESDPTKFYQCENGQVVVKNCPAGTEFSADSRVCLHHTPAETKNHHLPKNTINVDTSKDSYDDTWIAPLDGPEPTLVDWPADDDTSSIPPGYTFPPDSDSPLDDSTIWTTEYPTAIPDPDPTGSTIFDPPGEPSVPPTSSTASPVTLETDSDPTGSTIFDPPEETSVPPTTSTSSPVTLETDSDPTGSTIFDPPGEPSVPPTSSTASPVTLETDPNPTGSTIFDTTENPSVPPTTSTASPVTLEDSCEYLDNGCPADFDIHLLLPHETSCRKFYFCVRGERVLRSCASGLVFNTDVQTCDHAGSIDRTCEEESSSEEEIVSEESIEPEEIELLPNGCPVNYTISMYLPHEYYCNVYYQCVFGQKVSQRCPEGTHYNQEVQNCDHIAVVNCQLPGGNLVETTTTTAAPTTPSSFQPNGCPKDQSKHWLVAHEDCTKFYFCVWGGLVESNCPDGLYFNPVAQYCDNPALAGCANDPCKKKPCSNTNSTTESTTISTTAYTTPQTTNATTSFTTSPTELTSTTTIHNTSDLTTGSTTEAISTNTTTEAATESSTSSSTAPISDPTTETPTQSTLSSSTTSSNLTTSIPTEAPVFTTTTNISDPTTVTPVEATSSSSTIDISDPSSEDPTGNTSSSSTTAITNPTTDITSEATTSSTISQSTVTLSTTTVASNGTTSTAVPSSSSAAPTSTSSTAVPSSTTAASSSTTSSTTEDSCEYLDNGCPVDFDMHFLLPHEFSCRKFYICVRGEKVLRKCSSGLLFKPEIGNCAHPNTFIHPCGEESSSEEDSISEEYIEPDEIELLPNGCPVNYTISMYLPHEYYCNVYYQCVYGQWMERHCPSNTHFNPTIQNCDHIINANCSLPGGDTITTTTQVPSEGTTKPTDLLPNGCPVNGSINWMVAHEDCTKYFACVWGALLQMDCPDGTHFNAVEQYCDNPATAGCKICNKPCCSGNDGDNSCDGNGSPDDDNITEEDDDDDTDNSGEENSNENYNIDDENETEVDCDEAENKYECRENKKCVEDCSTLPRAHKDCDKYWVCYGKKAVLVTCAEGLHFNPSTSTCDYPCYAGCVRDKGQATPSNEGLKLFLPWDEIDEEMKSILERKKYL